MGWILVAVLIGLAGLGRGRAPARAATGGPVPGVPPSLQVPLPADVSAAAGLPASSAPRLPAPPPTGGRRGAQSGRLLGSRRARSRPAPRHLSR